MYSSLCGQTLVLQLLALLKCASALIYIAHYFSAAPADCENLLKAYHPEDSSEPKPLYTATPLPVNQDATPPFPTALQEEVAVDTEDVYEDMTEDASGPSPFHSHAPAAATVSTTDKLADLATHGSYTALSRGAAWEELKLDVIGPTLYSGLVARGLAPSALHWLGLLTERLLDCPQSVPLLVPALLAAVKRVRCGMTHAYLSSDLRGRTSWHT